MPLMLWIIAALTLNPVFAGKPQIPKKTVPHLASHTTVLPLSEGPALVRGQVDKFWTPDASDLRKLERDMPRSIRSYYRQYIGIVQGGKRLILINGFSAKVAPQRTGGKVDWHRHAVVAMDGGKLFFKATYNPKTRQFVGPQFNGMG